MNFIDPQLLPLTILDKSYNPYLVVLSVIIAIIASFTAFGIAERIKVCTSNLIKIRWIFYGVFTMGVGIWTMHFIGLLAINIPVAISYNLKITFLSLIPAIFASSVVLWRVNLGTVGLKKNLLCSVLLGAGISAMHYIGMMAMELNANMFYIKSKFIFSLIVAVVLSAIALNIKDAEISQDKYLLFNKNQSIRAFSMGLAISCMHFVAMEAVVFVPNELFHNGSATVSPSILSGMIAVVVLLMLIVAIIVPNTVRFKQMVDTLQKNEEDLKIAAIAFQTHEAILVTDGDGVIVRANNAFSRVSGYSEDEVIGKNPRLLKSEKQDDFFYKNFWNTIINEGKWSGKIWNRNKDGEIFAEWQTVSAVKDEHGNITHYVSFYSDVLEFKLAEKEIEKLAFYDPLTQLPNRRLLYERLEHELNIARRYQRAGILFFLDLDRFKQINDSLGHSIGDQLLIETAKRLQSLLRDTDTAVRLGGDEFIVLVSAQDGIHTDLLEQSNVIAEKIIKAISHPYFIADHELFITTSIGISLYTGIDETVDVLLKRADTAMYQAKESGRNTFRFYQKSMQDAVDARLQIESNLRLALKNKELSLYYQPQISDENNVIGVEALLQWKNPELGLVSPRDFIKIANETGLIVKIGQWIVELVCEQIIEWDKEDVVIPYVAINISAKQFYQSDFVSKLVHVLADKKVQPDRIMLEITEDVFLGNLDEALDKMTALRAKGFSFAIDDFGTGYSSLTYLKELPFDQLKIDQSFVQGRPGHPIDTAIVKAIVVMAKSMGLELIAEGVETKQHVAYLSSFGCHYYQGFYFCKPTTAKKVGEYAKKHSSQYGKGE
ncbi:MAG: EAL domain-containing protein [Methylococcales bacterium]|nr:EAL domain-containing protein [Methylococcales bacterium]